MNDGSDKQTLPTQVNNNKGQQKGNEKAAKRKASQKKSIKTFAYWVPGTGCRPEGMVIQKAAHASSLGDSDDDDEFLPCRENKDKLKHLWEGSRTD